MFWIMILNRPVIRTPSAKNNKKWKPATARAAALRACRDARVKARPYGLSRPCCNNPRKYKSTHRTAHHLCFLSRSSRYPLSPLSLTLSSTNFCYRLLSAVAGLIPAATVSSKLPRNLFQNSHMVEWYNEADRAPKLQVQGWDRFKIHCRILFSLALK